MAERQVLGHWLLIELDQLRAANFNFEVDHRHGQVMSGQGATGVP